MSYLNPSAPTRSDGSLADQLSDQARRDAEILLGDAAARKAAGDQFADFFQWQRLKEDVLHFQPFDSLPIEQQNAIKIRRRKQLEESYVPWIVSDLTGLLTGLDDIDDMGKTAQFLKRYALDPTAALVAKWRQKAEWNVDPDLRAYRRACQAKVPRREKKRIFIDAAAKTQFPNWGAGLLAALYPAWGFAALLGQALQTSDAVFGVGLQLGPLIGTIEEALFRGAAALGLPFSPAGNKYNQILAQRVTQRSNRMPAAWRALHPEDRLSSLTALLAASDAGLNEKIFIPPSDYPDAINMFSHPAQELGNFLGLAASLPYNMASLAFDALELPILGNWSETVQGPGATGFAVPGMNNIQRQIAKLLEKGICPGDHCDAELLQIISILRQAEFRVIPHPELFKPLQKVALNFNMILDEISGAPGFFT
jgi:hypothetical protein